MLTLLFYYFIFPGLLFIAGAGILASWADRKVTARIHWRQGPTILQPFYDLRKLFVKETILPAGGTPWLFIASPFIAVIALMILSNSIILPLMYPGAGFIGDLIVVFYLLMVPALASILGASASHSPYASIGASRETKLLLSYEVPLFLSLLVPVIKSGTLSVGNLILFQNIYGSFAGSISGFLALCVAVICIQAKMGLVPFDVAEAETEIAGGSQSEYSGPLLALWKLSKMMILVVAPLFVVAVFWGKGGAFVLTLKYLALLVVAILIRNTNPRLRIDQIMKFFWGPVIIVSILAVVLAWFGL